MKRILVGAISAAALALSANAADLPMGPYVKAPPPNPLYDWSGFYIGVNGGGGSARKCWDFATEPTGAPVVPRLNEGCHDATGGTAGGQIGYRWQAQSYVFGVEGQGNWADFSGRNTSLSVTNDGSATTNHSRLDAFGLITGQAGYAWNNVLWYVKGGAAVVGDKFDVFNTPSSIRLSSAQDTRWGSTVGTGLEVGFAPSWSLGFEYNHIFLGDRDISLTTPAGGFDGTDRIRQNVDMGLVRVNYRWGGPVISNY
jgi:outer membrane immunogenic protein